MEGDVARDEGLDVAKRSLVRGFPSEWRVLLGEVGEGSCNARKVRKEAAVEVDKAHEHADFVDVGRRGHVEDCLGFLCAWPDGFAGDGESETRAFFESDEGFFGVHFDAVASAFGEDLLEMGEVGCVIRRKGVEVVKVGLQEAEVDLLFEERRDRAVEVVRHVPEAHGRGEVFEHAEGGGEGGAL